MKYDHIYPIPLKIPPMYPIMTPPNFINFYNSLCLVSVSHRHIGLDLATGNMETSGDTFKKEGFSSSRNYPLLIAPNM